jgi:hypothetical protein
MILDARRDDAARRNKYDLLFLNRDGTQELGERLDNFFATRSSEEYGYPSGRPPTPRSSSICSSACAIDRRILRGGISHAIAARC